LSETSTTLDFVLTTDQKGAIAESEIAAAAIKLGVGVYRPLSDGARYDLVFDVGSRLLRVQCKWAARTGDVIVIRATEVDLIAAYCLDLDRCFLLSADRFDGRTHVQLRTAPSRNNQLLGINWADDFDFVARLGALVGP
jgi:hypothetical protein